MQQQLSMQKLLGQQKLMQHAVQRSASASLSQHPLFQMQQTIGNHGQLRRSGLVIQAKLKIGAPNDKYEQEADRLAEAVMRMPEREVQRQSSEEVEEQEEQLQTKPIGDQITPLVQRQPETQVEQVEKEEEEEEEEETIQAKENSGRLSEVTPDVDAHISALRGKGQPLPESTRAFFEPRFGYDFGQVRIHTDSSAGETARLLNARALTLGWDIVFGFNEYQPNTSETKRLLAHELTHVLQQRKMFKDLSSSQSFFIQHKRKTREIEGLPFKLPVPKTLSDAKILYEYLVGERKNSKVAAKLLIIRKCLQSKPKSWLRSLERTYAHQNYNIYVVIENEGTPLEHARLEGAGRTPRESPLRKDLKEGLGVSKAKSFVDDLEKATRFRLLKPEERAEAELSSNQRRIAKLRAKGYERVVAEWLFEKRNWTYLVNNAGIWGQGELCGFFEKPMPLDRANWPKNAEDSSLGDKAYLAEISRNLKNIIKSFDESVDKLCGARIVGFIGASAEAILWAHAMPIQRMIEKFRLLRNKTGTGVEKVLPRKIIWGPPAKTIVDLCRK